MRLAVTLAAAVLALAGCGSESPEAASDGPSSAPSTPTDTPSETSSGGGSASPAAQVAAGPELSADGISFHAPQGWVDVTEKAEDGVLLRAAKVSGDDVVPQIVVMKSSAPARSTGAASRYAVRDLRGSGATRIQPGAPVKIGGRSASAVTAVMSGQGTPMSVYRYDVAVDGTTWTIAYSDSKWRVQADKQALIDSVLASWQWS
jgi:hypothetical protein